MKPEKSRSQAQQPKMFRLPKFQSHSQAQQLKRFWQQISSIVQPTQLTIRFYGEKCSQWPGQPAVWNDSRIKKNRPRSSSPGSYCSSSTHRPSQPSQAVLSTNQCPEGTKYHNIRTKRLWVMQYQCASVAQLVR